MQPTSPIRNEASTGEEGFLLLAMVFAVAVILIFLAVAAPSVAKDLQREREIEMVHRGDQYVRAIRLYYRKNNAYPTSIDQLVKSNNIRYLRQKYVDPMTGKDDWRIIHVGENKTQVTGFFGQPLAGLNASGGLGSANSMVSTTGGTGGAGSIGAATGTAGAAFGNSTFGSSSGSSSGSAFDNSSLGSGSGSSSGSAFDNSSFGGGSISSGGSGSSFGSSNAPGSTGTGTGSGTGTPGSSGPGSTDATNFDGSGGGPIMGVSSLSTKTSIIEIRKQTTYNTWEFIYDPRIETLYAKANIFGGGVASSSGGNGFGQSIGIGTPGSTTNSTAPGAPGSSTSSGSSSGSSFGSSGSSFGSSGSSFGSGSSNSGSNSPFSSGP